MRHVFTFAMRFMQAFLIWGMMISVVTASEAAQQTSPSDVAPSDDAKNTGVDAQTSKPKEVKYKYKPNAKFPNCEPPGLLFDLDEGFEGYGALVITSLPVSLATTTAMNMVYSTAKISGIDGCEKIAAIKFQQYRFTAIAKDNLVKDMARGGGEYVTALAHLQGCPIEIHSRYAAMTQLNFHQIIPGSETKPKTILSNLEIEIVKDPLLAKECKWVL